MQRGDELGVAADAGEVGDGTPRGGDAGFRGGLLEMVLLFFPEGGGLGLTAQVGSSVRLEALAKGAARRARATMGYFIFYFSDSSSSSFLGFFFSFLFLLWFVVVVFFIKKLWSPAVEIRL